MKAGILISQFSTQGGFGAAAIRYLSAGSVSHVDLVVPIAIAMLYRAPSGEDWRWIPNGYGLLGARLDGGVQLRQANYAKFTRSVRLGCMVPDIDAAYKFAFEQIGKPYNKGAILDFFLHKFGKENVFNPDQKSWFCDELNYEIYKAGGVQLLNEANPLNLSPEAEMCSPYLKVQQAV